MFGIYVNSLCKREHYHERCSQYQSHGHTGTTMTPFSLPGFFFLPFSSFAVVSVRD